MCDAEYSFLLWLSVRVGLSTAVFQNHRWDILKKCAVYAMIEIQKRRTTIGRLLLHMLGDLTAHDGSRAVISFLWQQCSQ